MNKNILATVAIFAVITGIFLWYFSDKQVIKRKTLSLVESFNVEEGDGNATRLLKNSDLMSLLSKDFTCSVDLQSYTQDLDYESATTGHKYLMHKVVYSKLSINDLAITSISDTSATIETTFTSSLEVNNSAYNETGKATFMWKKADSSQWELASVLLQ